jgi:hypothetical protein
MIFFKWYDDFVLLSSWKIIEIAVSLVIIQYGSNRTVMEVSCCEKKRRDCFVPRNDNH